LAVQNGNYSCLALRHLTQIRHGCSRSHLLTISVDQWIYVKVLSPVHDINRAMTEAEFLESYKKTLRQIEETVEAAINDEDADIDYESGNDMLTLSFTNGSVAIISRQSAICQLWLAARSGGFHFERDAGLGQWVCTVNDRTLTQMLEGVCREQGDLSLAFPPL
jgi:CyaY protein